MPKYSIHCSWAGSSAFTRTWCIHTCTCFINRYMQLHVTAYFNQSKVKKVAEAVFKFISPFKQYMNVEV